MAGRYSPTYLIMILALWFIHSDAVNSAENRGPIPVTSMAQFTGNFHPVPTIDYYPARNILNSALTGQKLFRKKRSDVDYNSQAGSFRSGARTANDALKDFLKILTMSKPAFAGAMEDYDEDFQDQPMDLVVSRKPGSGRSVRISKPKETHYAIGEEPLDTPIDLVQHHPKAKRLMSPVNPELFLREAAVSSRTQPEPKVMRKLLERIGYNWNLLP